MPALPRGQRLRLLREEADLPLEQLARLADCSPGHLRQIETGYRQPSPRLARRILRALTVTLKREISADEFGFEIDAAA